MTVSALLHEVSDSALRAIESGRARVLAGDRQAHPILPAGCRRRCRNPKESGRKAHFLVVDLSHSDDGFVKAFPAETTEAFCEGHDAAFGYFGGVPHMVVYDNTKLAVARILGDGERQRPRTFTELESHYLFADRFGRPGKGNDKGDLAGLVGCARRSYMVPIPRFPSWEVSRAPQK